MKTFNKISGSGFAAALLITAAMGSSYAEDADMTQLRTQDRTRTEVNLQAPTSDFGQARNSEQLTVKNQNQNQYRYMNTYSNGQSDTAAGSMNRQSSANRSMTGGRH